MNVKDILEAKTLSHGKWEQFQYYAKRSLPDNVSRIFASTNFKPFFEEIMLSFNFFYDMSLDHMDEMPGEYTEKDREPAELAKWWKQIYFDALGDELTTHNELRNSVPIAVLDTVGSIMMTWIVNNVDISNATSNYST